MKIVKTAANLLICVSLLSPVVVLGATTRTFDGGDAVNPVDIGLKTNWSGDTLPSVSGGDTAQWDGTVSGTLALTYSGGLAGSSGNAGISLSMAPGQASDMSIDGSGASIRVSNFTNNSPTAAFTLGGSGAITLIMAPNGPSTQTWVNNSAGTVTVGPKVTFSMAGGNVHTWVLQGPGNFGISNYIAPTSGSLNIWKNNAGTLILNPAGGTLSVGSAGTATINAGRLIIAGTGAFLGGSVPTYSIDGFQYGSVVVNTNGILDLGGISTIINGLSGSLGTVDTLAGGSVTLTVGANGNNGGTFSGVITNTAGPLGLVVAGTNILTLSGTNSYTGGTIVSNGTLLVNGSIAGNVTVLTGASFGGTGTIPGAVDWSASGSTLTLVANQPLNLTGTATLNNNTVVVNVPGVNPLSTGTYTLMNYTPGNVTGSLSSTPIFTGAGAVPGSYTIWMTNAGTVTLTIVSSVAVDTWTNSASGNWTAGANWDSNPNVPHVAGDVASLGMGTAYTTVTLDAPETVGALNFTNGNSFALANVGNTLTLDNSGSGASIRVSGGSSNLIAAPVLLNDSATITVNSGDVLSLSNTISATSGQILIKAGAGTLSLSGTNTYGPSAGIVGTVLSGGTLQVGNARATGAGDLTISNSSTLGFAGPLTFTNNIYFPSSATLTINDGGNAATLGSLVTGSGGLTKSGSGTTTIANSANAYTGTTLAAAGTLVLGNNGATYGVIQASGNGALLQIPSAATITVNNGGAGNLIVDQGATLEVDSSAVLNVTSTGFGAVGNSVGAPVSSFNINGGTVFYNANFVVARNSSGTMTIANSGVFSNGQFYVGQTAGGTGTLNLNSGGTLITSQVTSQTGTGNLLYFNGGVVKSTGLNSGNLLLAGVPTLLSVYVRNGGGTIDNGGFSNRLDMPLLHSTVPGDNAADGGLTFVGIGTNVFQSVTNTYTGPTVITAGTVELKNSVFNPVSVLSISNGAVLQLDDVVTNSIGGLILNGVSQPNGLYSSNNVPNYLTGGGALRVGPAGPIAPTNSPTITQINLANVGPGGGDVVLSGTNGNAGATYFLLMSTNIAAPLVQWRTVATNVATGNAFMFTETNAVTVGAGQQFYILSSTNYNP